MNNDLTTSIEEDDFCAECSSLGDDFYIDENGELQNACYDEFWRAKILRNVERDKEVTKVLEDDGWTVLRIWESTIKSDLDGCVQLVESTYRTLLTNSKPCE